MSLPAVAQKKIITLPGSKSHSPYSPGVLADGTLYIAGQIGTDPKTGKRPDAFADEVKLAIEGIGQVLKLAGMDYSNTVSVTVYLTDMSLFEPMNEVYRTFFKADFPARATVGVASLFGGARIEISAIARK